MYEKKQYALIGGRLGHSLSPFIHKKLFELSGENACYTLSALSEAEFESTAFHSSALDGFNVTIPYKTKIIKKLDNLSEKAKLYNSVNTVLRSADNTLTGYNTDVYGFLKAIELLGTSLSSGKVLLLGAGGSANMIATEVILAGADLTVAVRESGLERAKKLKKMLESRFVKPAVHIITFDNIKGKYNLLVNATPVGMYPDINGCAVADEVIENVRYVFDLVYNPFETKLIKKAKALRKKAQGGLDMLVWQAVYAHRIWYNAEFSESDINAIVNKTKRKLKYDFQSVNLNGNIYLCGFMGCGKTTVGKILARKLNVEFIDTDKIIEKSCNMKISRIFKQNGEEYFRLLENKLLQDTKNDTPKVIATGGGMFTNTMYGSDNVNKAKSNGEIIFLKSGFEACYERIKNDKNRPIAQENSKEELKALFEERQASYLLISDKTVVCKTNPYKTAMTAVNILKQKRNKK